MTEPVKVVVIINDGGLIEQIISDNKSVKVLVINYDIDGYDGDDVITVDDTGPAQAGIWEPYNTSIEALEFLNKAFQMSEDKNL